MFRIYLKSSRFIHWIPIFLNSIAATLIVGGDIISALWIGLQISCIASFSFVFNDVLDAKIDKLNWEKRMSELSKNRRNMMGFFSISYLLVAFISCILFVPSALNIMLLLTATLFGYNIIFKKILFLGNIIAAITIMSPIAIPYLLYNTNDNPFIIVIVASGIIYNFAREILLDVIDVNGDSEFGRHTFPVIFGSKKSITLSMILYVLACSILILSPFVINFEINIFLQCLISIIFLIIFLLSFSKLKFLIHNSSSERITLNNLQPFIVYSRLIIMLFPVVLLIYYFAQ